MAPIDTIERLAVNSWRGSDHLSPAEHWHNVSREFFGIYRLCLWQGEAKAAELAELISDIAAQRWLLANIEDARAIRAEILGGDIDEIVGTYQARCSC